MIATKPLRQKKCKQCRTLFTPTRPLQVACSTLCAIALAEKARAKATAVARKARTAEDRRRKQAMKTIPDLIREAQAAFNAFVRTRDRDKGCICCGEPLGEGEIGGAYDCGHYRSRGSAGHLRFNEDNAHAQRKYCNRHKAGNAVDYRIGLIRRIGIERVEAIESDNRTHKWTREELEGIRDLYRGKLKGLKERENETSLLGDAVKRTTVRPEDEHDQKRRQGFVPVCCYGRIEPEANEIGGIFKDVRNARIERGLEVHDAKCVERIFVASSGGD